MSDVPDDLSSIDFTKAVSEFQAALVNFAHLHAELYKQLRSEGLNTREALEIVKTVIQTQLTNGR